MDGFTFILTHSMLLINMYTLKSLHRRANLVFQFAKQKFLLHANFHISRTTNYFYGKVSSIPYKILKIQEIIESPKC